MVSMGLNIFNMNYKTLHDIEIVSQSGDKITIKGLSYSTIMTIAKSNTELQSITITKQYDKKLK
jgi:ribosomal protein L6P/L9E